MAIQLDLDKICVICLQESNDPSTIYDEDEDQLSYYDKIVKLFPEYKDVREENRPNNICQLCVKDLDAAHRFYSNCETAVSLFRCSPISQELENGTFVQIKAMTDDEVQGDETHKKDSLEPEHSNTQEGSEAEQIEYVPEFCEFDELNLSYSEEHLEDESEAANEEVTESGSETNTLDNEAQCQLDKSVALSLSEGDTTTPVENVSKNASGKTKKLKYRKKGEKGARSPKICEICGNTYRYQHALNSHMRRHFNVKPFNCECCDKAFVSNVELRRHMRVHTGDKPYSCLYCERKFSDYGSRIKHQRTHTGERPFVCPTCNKSFAYAHVLSVHLRTHTGEKKFRCPQCEKGFTKKSYMLAHMEQHRRRAMVVSKEEEEDDSQYSTYERRQSTTATTLNSVIEDSEEIQDPCITTYIVEEIDPANGDLKILTDSDQKAETLRNIVICKENVLGM